LQPKYSSSSKGISEPCYQCKLLETNTQKLGDGCSELIKMLPVVLGGAQSGTMVSEWEHEWNREAVCEKEKGGWN
jgi:hypothetical protein